MVGDAKAAPPVGLAVQQQTRARRVALDQPGLVEERRAHRRASRRTPSPPPAGACRAGAPAARRSLRTSTATVACSPARSAGDRARLAAVARQMLEQIADRVQPERRAGPSAIFLARQLQRGLQARRAAASARARRSARSRLERSRGGERARAAADAQPAIERVRASSVSVSVAAIRRHHDRVAAVVSARRRYSAASSHQ